MKEELERLKEKFSGEIRRVESSDQLKRVRIRVLGRKGDLTGFLRKLGSLPPQDRREMGIRANQIKKELEELFEQKRVELQQKEQKAILERERIDVTLPGKRVFSGHLHPVTLVCRRIKDIFQGLGFSTAMGPELETDSYNFEGLNMPEDHPAREMWDSFYIAPSLLLRSHTSPVQVRVMEKVSPPLRVISLGRCYRRDAVDATHSWMFHQVEGFMVDERVTFADLKGVLGVFAREMFGRERRVKFLPGYFPFTEPSAEVYIDCFLCKGKGCRGCGGSGWMEILGAGMIHPRVFEYADRHREKKVFDPEKVSGFAFGMGVERIAMLLYGINDIRLFFENDLKFLEQF